MCIHHTGITVHPQPWNATLGSTVKFNCIAILVLESDEVNWRINELSSTLMEVLEPDVDEQRNGNISNSTLTVTANVEGTTAIQCRVSSDISLPVLSQEVNLTVQGNLQFVAYTSVYSTGVCTYVCCHRVLCITVAIVSHFMFVVCLSIEIHCVPIS